MKTEFRFFSIVEYEKEQKYLEKRHGEGWEFTGVTFPGFYHFEKCEPRAMIYQLDYNQEGLAHKEEYVQMFKGCGWEYLMDFAGIVECFEESVFLYVCSIASALSYSVFAVRHSVFQV